ncbi:Bacteriophytochrome (light-regulated signal transduction histidine kinase) [Algoriphagus locisalis]|uniref:histidine kinase n=1 Tax=Algoriphagus locisalis TaxID=305507 RepID=A0A1I7DWP6_9BACT|nr:ATP-binding protein [Algoriphagus locisalis]SFU16089.1 Bacteriophytochrome (light-regulated signal transduction histidine kinase) [Algoriphagus locisalis]
MKVKDIVNREIVNLTNCEQEPIHIPGSIQPNGFLMGLKEDSLLIDYCSANTSVFIGKTHTDLLGKTFGDAFGEDAETELLDYISKDRMLSSLLLKTILLGKEFLCTVHKSNATVIVEAEPINSVAKQVNEVYDHTSQFLSYMHTTQSLQDLCGLVAKGTREITGYDRVMIYRFDGNYNGEVFAESCREDLEPFLGLHYPHTDIPPQARELYMKNLLRIITDIDYSPVPIYTLDDKEDKTLDLSLSILRSTSPIHVQYLHNMGVGATLTISLIYKQRLWGLIACHHYSPKNLTPEMRLAAQLQGHFITSQIDVRQSNEEYEVSRKVNAAFDKMDAFELSDNPASFAELIKKPELLGLCNANGVSLVFEGKVYLNGVTPSEDEVKFLAGYFAEYTENSSISTSKLLDILPDYASLCENTAGAVYHSLDMEGSNCIIWYRSETKTEVNWAGDPSKSIILDKKGLSPRNSFELWKEIVNCTSKPWLQPELDTAAAYSNGLQRQINLIKITQEEQKYRKLSEMLKEANAELENMNWISSHDLQEPLRKMQLISSHLLYEDEIPEAAQKSLKRLNISAERMQTLLQDILKYTRLKYSEEDFELVGLNQLVGLVADELTEDSEAIELKVGSLPQIMGVPFFLKQLFSNLISNSIKYSKTDVPIEIQIKAKQKPVAYPTTKDESYYLIKVIDNGIGFEQKYAESIFNVFTRLHLATEYSGSGVGLALCKKIVKNHRGYITAKSSVGKGTEISIYFPVEG